METTRRRETGAKPERKEQIAKPTLSTRLTRKLEMFGLLGVILSSSASAQEMERGTSETEPVDMQETAPYPETIRGMVTDLPTFQQLEREAETVPEAKNIADSFSVTQIARPPALHESVGYGAKQQYPPAPLPKLSHKGMQEQLLRGMVFQELHDHSSIDAIWALDDLLGVVENFATESEADHASKAHYLTLIEHARESYVRNLQQLGIRDVEALVGKRPEVEASVVVPEQVSFLESLESEVLRDHAEPSFHRFELVRDVVERRVRERLAKETPAPPESVVYETVHEAIREALFRELRKSDDGVGNALSLEILLTDCPVMSGDDGRTLASKETYRQLVMDEMAIQFERQRQNIFMAPAVYSVDVSAIVEQQLRPRVEVDLEFKTQTQERLENASWSELLTERQITVRRVMESRESGELLFARDGEKYLAELDQVLKQKQAVRAEQFRAQMYEHVIEQMLSSERVVEEIDLEKRQGGFLIDQIRGYKEGIDLSFRLRDVVQRFDQQNPEGNEGAADAMEVVTSCRELLSFLQAMDVLSPAIQRRAAELLETVEVFALVTDELSQEKIQSLYQSVATLRSAAEQESAFQSRVELLAHAPNIKEILSEDGKELLKLQVELDELRARVRRSQKKKLHARDFEQITGVGAVSDELGSITSTTDRLPGFGLFTKTFPSLRDWSPNLYPNIDTRHSEGEKSWQFNLMLDDARSPLFQKISEKHEELFEKRREIEAECSAVENALVEAILQFDSDLVRGYNEAIALEQ